MHPGWRLWLSLTVATVLAVLTSVTASVKIADANTAASIARARAASAEQHRVSCELAARILASYEEVPPPSSTGKNVADAWREEYRVLGCQPTK